MPVTAGKPDSRALLASISKGLFWDADVSELDADAHAGYIIPRVMDHGSWEDVKSIWAYYGTEQIKEHLIVAPSLLRRTISFFASYFRIRPSDLKAQRKLYECKTWNR